MRAQRDGEQVRVGDGGDERLQEDALSSYAEWSMSRPGRPRHSGEPETLPTALDSRVNRYE